MSSQVHYHQLSTGEHRRIRRFVTRQLRLRAIFRPRQASEYRLILRDEDLLEELCAQAWSTFAAQAPAPSSETPILDRLGELFQWIVENWDSIQMIIEWLMKLFIDLEVSEYLIGSYYQAFGQVVPDDKSHSAASWVVNDRELEEFIETKYTELIEITNDQ